MSDSPPTADAAVLPVPHAGATVKTYLAIWGALAVLTAVEIGVTFLPISHAVIVVSLLLMAVVKAGLVALFFMHLKFDGRVLRVLAVGPFLFVLILLSVLLLDVYFVQVVYG